MVYVPWILRGSEAEEEVVHRPRTYYKQKPTESLVICRIVWYVLRDVESLHLHFISFAVCFLFCFFQGGQC